eukprot:SAG22_NODE_655_length_8104_cov_6.498438_13_plen_182_part_00
MSCLLTGVPAWQLSNYPNLGEQTMQVAEMRAGLIGEVEGLRAQVSCKALPFCRASTVFLSKTVPLLAICLCVYLCVCVPVCVCVCLSVCLFSWRALRSTRRSRSGRCSRSRRVSCKALPFCCASTAFLSKTAPFLAVPLGQASLPGSSRKTGCWSRRRRRRTGRWPSWRTSWSRRRRSSAG